MSRSHVSDTTLTLGATGTPATPNGKKMVWNRRKQEWMEVDIEEGAEPHVTTSPFATRISSNSYASGISQNSGNFLTEKPITRVHAPPGGISTISFGGDEPATPAPAPVPVEDVTQPATPESAEEPSASVNEASVVDNESFSPASTTSMPVPPAEEVSAVAPPAPPSTGSVSANAYASGTNQNSGNFMTGRPTTRVRAPPGGVSSLTFG
ncbi:unnamed protein product [Choristocarpus tenellus]